MTYTEIIERFAQLAIEEIEEMADQALIELGWKPSSVNRRRGQLRRHQQRKERQ